MHRHYFKNPSKNNIRTSASSHVFVQFRACGVAHAYIWVALPPLRGAADLRLSESVCAFGRVWVCRRKPAQAAASELARLAVASRAARALPACPPARAVQGIRAAGMPRPHAAATLLLGGLLSAAAAAAPSCPPICPDVSFSAELRAAAAAELGLQIGPPSPELVGRQQDRPADDRHFYKQQAVAQLERYRADGISAADVTAAMGVSRATKCAATPSGSPAKERRAHRGAYQSLATRPA